MRYWIFLIAVLLTGCEDGGVADASIWQICEKYPDICEATHSGALCSIDRSDVIRNLAKQKEQLSSITTYLALKSLDNYKGCLENAFISEAVRNKSDKQSQITTIQNIPQLQQSLVVSTRTLYRPEVNLWLWTKSQHQNNWDSMVNGFESAEQVHLDVYLALMTEAAERDLPKALEYARMALQQADVIKDIPAPVYEFYIGYYLQQNELEKAAIWQGLYSALDEEKANVNGRYFRLNQQMTPSQIQAAQDAVDQLLFDAKWLNKTMSSFPKDLK